MRAIAASLVLIAATAPLAAQGMKAYLPAAAATKASSYLAAIDAANSGIKSKLAAARAEELAAESASLAAFALLYAADGGEEWADPEGSATSAGAAATFVEARAKVIGAASALSSGGAQTGGGGTAELEKKRDESAEKLGALIKDSKPGAKSAAGIEKLLADKIKDLGRLFPEIVEVQSYLRKAGTAGYVISAKAMAGGSAELAAAAYVEAADEILAAAPAAARAMESLAESYAAYAAWTSGFALASCPGELAISGTGGPEPLSRGIAAMAALDAARAADLIAAMESGDGREAAAAAAARRLAAVWESLGSSRRRELGMRCASRASAMAAFASAVETRPSRREPPAQLEARDVMSSINALAAAIADEEERGSRPGPEPSLSLLERPQLAAAAASEPRYADLYKRCSGRLGAIYRRAAEDASASLEALPSSAKAAARALGSAPASLVVEAVDIGPADYASGRVLSFVAIAASSSGRIVRLPIRAEIAAEAYARSFAKAAGLTGAAASGGSASGGVQKTLERYGQIVVTAYDPARAGGRLSAGSYPKDSITAALSSVDMEREMLEGWRP
jgi:trimeric autotransporter adhesin